MTEAAQEGAFVMDDSVQFNVNEHGRVEILCSERLAQTIIDYLNPDIPCGRDPKHPIVNGRAHITTTDVQWIDQIDERLGQWAKGKKIAYESRVQRKEGTIRRQSAARKRNAKRKR